MHVQDLRGLGLPESIIANWKANGIEQLTSLQETCLQDEDLLNGKNALVIAPTSAGKTFIGEVLAVRAALHLQRAIYVVPFKALAEEKYRTFRSLYEPIGISVAVSSGDRAEFDEDIRRGRYRITVVVNEKLSQLFVQNPGMITDCGLIVVFDEIQMVRDLNRGPSLEMLLTRLLVNHDRPHVIGLSAAVGSLNKFDEWMQSKVIRSSDRPVPLTEYALLENGQVITYDASKRVKQLSQIPLQAN